MKIKHKLYNTENRIDKSNNDKLIEMEDGEVWKFENIDFNALLLEKIETLICKFEFKIKEFEHKKTKEKGYTFNAFSLGETITHKVFDGSNWKFIKDIEPENPEELLLFLIEGIKKVKIK